MRKVGCLTSYADVPEDPEAIHMGDKVTTTIRVDKTIHEIRGEVTRLTARLAEIRAEGRTNPLLVYISELRKVPDAG